MPSWALIEKCWHYSCFVCSPILHPKGLWHHPVWHSVRPPGGEGSCLLFLPWHYTAGCSSSVVLSCTVVFCDISAKLYPRVKALCSIHTLSSYFELRRSFFLVTLEILAQNHGVSLWDIYISICKYTDAPCSVDVITLVIFGSTKHSRYVSFNNRARV